MLDWTFEIALEQMRQYEMSVQNHDRFSKDGSGVVVVPRVRSKVERVWHVPETCRSLDASETCTDQSSFEQNGLKQHASSSLVTCTS